MPVAHRILWLRHDILRWADETRRAAGLGPSDETGRHAQLMPGHAQSRHQLELGPDPP